MKIPILFLQNYKNIFKYCKQNLYYAVPRTIEEMKQLLNSEVTCPKSSKILKVTVLGPPNCGKSTLINNVIKQKVCDVSAKVHTTQKITQAVVTIDDTQIVFLDTPGVVTSQEVSKYKLNRTLVVSPEKSLIKADLILVVHDASNKYARKSLHQSIQQLLKLYRDVPALLVINKIDKLKSKTVLLEMAMKFNSRTILSVKHDDFNLDISDPTPIDETQKIDKDHNGLSYEKNINEGEGHQLHEGKQVFQETFMVSALQGDGIDSLKQHLLLSAKPGPWIFNQNVLTDLDPQQLAIQTVREKCLENMLGSVAYLLSYEIVFWMLTEYDVLRILLNVYTNKHNYNYVLGRGGRRIRKVAEETENSLRNAFRCDIRLRIEVQIGIGKKK